MRGSPVPVTDPTRPMSACVPSLCHPPTGISATHDAKQSDSTALDLVVRVQQTDVPLDHRVSAHPAVAFKGPKYKPLDGWAATSHTHCRDASRASFSAFRIWSLVSCAARTAAEGCVVQG